MNKVEIIYWVSGHGLDTKNESLFYRMPSEEVNSNFDANAMKIFRASRSTGWREVINILNHGKLNDVQD